MVRLSQSFSRKNTKQVLIFWRQKTSRLKTNLLRQLKKGIMKAKNLKKKMKTKRKMKMKKRMIDGDAISELTWKSLPQQNLLRMNFKAIHFLLSRSFKRKMDLFTNFVKEKQSM
ncbi:unnamed protein product [Larinioides sclopetarius]|uniref:Uncharacterized protein n=1 Tax=Larinioides sclopetarius TaxID=280406 RepID=A0AAV2BY39_9ARAC